MIRPAAKMPNPVVALAAGLIIGGIHFPKGVKPGAIDPAILHSLGVVYVPTQIVLYGTATLLLLGYRITRASHHDTLRRLAAAADLVAEGEPAGATGGLS